MKFSKVWRKIFRPFLDYPLQQALFETGLSRTLGRRKNTGKNLLMNQYIIRYLSILNIFFHLIFTFDRFWSKIEAALKNLFSFKCPAYRSIATLPKYIDPKIVREPEDVKRNRSKSLAPKKTQRSEKPLRRYLCTHRIFRRNFYLLDENESSTHDIFLRFFTSVSSKDIIISYRHKLGIRNSDRSTAKNAAKNFSQSTKLKSNFNFIEKKIHEL